MLVPARVVRACGSGGGGLGPGACFLSVDRRVTQTHTHTHTHTHMYLGRLDHRLRRAGAVGGLVRKGNEVKYRVALVRVPFFFINLWLTVTDSRHVHITTTLSAELTCLYECGCWCVCG